MSVFSKTNRVTDAKPAELRPAPRRHVETRLSCSILTNRGLQLEHLSLLHHFTVSTSATLGFRQLTREVWQTSIPREACSHEFLMHGILAASAQHLAFLDPDRKAYFQVLSAHHQNRAIAGYKSVVGAEVAQYATPLYAFSAIVVIFVCSGSSADWQGASSPIDRLLHFFRTCTGVEILLRRWRGKVVNSSLAPLMQLGPSESQTTR